uniref:Uncharacterized protein n=1 Tax=Rhizophora mucronata TaxID=61149 RepID=A0A2P2R1B7_RHIMU
MLKCLKFLPFCSFSFLFLYFLLDC